MPWLSDIDSINGYSQPGSVQNTLVPDQQGLNTVLKIEIDGENVTGDGLTLEPPPSNTTGATGVSTIQGLAINRFSGNGITINSYGGDSIAGNFIGTDVSGTIALGNGENGIYINDVNNAAIGGNANGAANLISGNGGDGIYDLDDGTAGLIENDVIGGGRTPTAALPNTQDGVDASRLGGHRGRCSPSRASVTCINPAAGLSGGDEARSCTGGLEPCVARNRVQESRI